MVNWRTIIKQPYLPGRLITFIFKWGKFYYFKHKNLEITSIGNISALHSYFQCCVVMSWVVKPPHTYKALKSFSRWYIVWKEGSKLQTQAIFFKSTSQVSSNSTNPIPFDLMEKEPAEKTCPHVTSITALSLTSLLVFGKKIERICLPAILYHHHHHLSGGVDGGCCCCYRRRLFSRRGERRRPMPGLG